MGILGLINVRSYTVGSWLRFGTHMAFGSAVCLLTTLASGSGDRAENLSETAWPLPMIAIIVFIGTPYHRERLERVLLTRNSARCPSRKLGGHGSREIHRREAISLPAPMATKSSWKELSMMHFF